MVPPLTVPVRRGLVARSGRAGCHARSTIVLFIIALVLLQDGQSTAVPQAHSSGTGARRHRAGVQPCVPLQLPQAFQLLLWRFVQDDGRPSVALHSFLDALAVRRHHRVAEERRDDAHGRHLQKAKQPTEEPLIHDALICDARLQAKGRHERQK
eukprot:6493763-Prymnesium_polylepis.1